MHCYDFIALYIFTVKVQKSPLLVTSKVTAVRNCQLKCSIDVSAASNGDQKHPINVTDDLLLLLAALVQLDGDSWDVEAYSL